MSQPPPSSSQPTTKPAVKRQRANSLGDTNTRRRRAKQPAAESADAGDAPTSDVNTDVNTGTVNDVNNLRYEVNTLKTIITKHESTIANLERKLNTILNAFNIQSTDVIPDTGNIMSTSVLSDRPVQQLTHPQPTSSQPGAVNVNPTITRTAPPDPTVKLLRQNIIATVYTDLKDHERRSRNIVISGVPFTNEANDPPCVQNMLECEFKVKPVIVRCRRLGKVQPGRIQPLLVTFRNDDQASFLISNAKQLRNSADLYTKQSVFINRDVTKAEAYADFIARRDRRLRAAARQNAQLMSIDPSSQLPPATDVVPTATTTSTPTATASAISTSFSSAMPAAAAAAAPTALFTVPLNTIAAPPPAGSASRRTN